MVKIVVCQFSTNFGNISCLVSELSNLRAEFGLNLNMKKTKWMVFDKNQVGGGLVVLHHSEIDCSICICIDILVFRYMYTETNYYMTIDYSVLMN